MQYIHGQNLEGKLKNKKLSAKNRALAEEIYIKYKKWRDKNEKIAGMAKEDVYKKVDLLNEYKNFVNKPKFKKEKGRRYGFKPQDKLHPTILEEFCFYLFKDIETLKNGKLEMGPIRIYTDLGFSPLSLEKMKKDPGIDIGLKDQDFAIGKKVICIIKSNSYKRETEIFIPIIAVECKTYLDKTMYDSAAGAAERLKKGNPYCLYIIITEYNAMREEINIKKTRIDQIYILRKQKSKARPMKLIDKNIVWEFFNYVKFHLKREWWNPKEATLKGKLANY